VIAFATYLVLLAVSTGVRTVRPPPDPPRDVPIRRIALPGGRTVTIAFDQRCPSDAGLPATTSGFVRVRPGPDGVPVERLPVVLLHGSPGGRFDFHGVTPALAGDRCVIAPDLPGFGDSTRDVPDYGVEAHAAYVEALLDALAMPRAHVVGFSMGGGVAIALAARAPGRVASLTLLAGLGVQELELFGRYAVNHAVHGLQLAALWLLVEATPHFGLFDRMFLGVEYARNFYDTDQRPLRPALLAFDGPALVVHGRHDILVPYAAALEHHRLLPQSELVTTEGDHFDTFMRPAQVADALVPFLAAVDRGARPTRSTAPADRRAAAARPYDGRIGTAHMGLRLAIEVGAGVVLVLAVGAMAWRRRRRALRLRLQ
jgi:pimeloyl-ACP methyl ester carboxylesterase